MLPSAETRHTTTGRRKQYIVAESRIIHRQFRPRESESEREEAMVPRVGPPAELLIRLPDWRTTRPDNCITSRQIDNSALLRTLATKGWSEQRWIIGRHAKRQSTRKLEYNELEDAKRAHLVYLESIRKVSREKIQTSKRDKCEEVCSAEDKLRVGRKSTRYTLQKAILTQDAAVCNSLSLARATKWSITEQQKPPTSRVTSLQRAKDMKMTC